MLDLGGLETEKAEPFLGAAAPVHALYVHFGLGMTYRALSSVLCV